ncbi:ATP-binding protein [Verrucomicrobium sp. BvORR034]|uniref:ATP-binding protein n=1 Tax=Verrucomicrobium sp. BvORR034 TaxID=1396418 RepID=UPI0006793FF9|nr:ATP-binding protein [Verrucomicrobium sp. BvORR034]
MSSAPETLQLLAVELRTEHDLVLCRQRARQLGEALGFDRQAQTAIATAVSEIARNAYDYAGGGRIEFKVQTAAHVSRNPHRALQSLVVVVKDKGKGIPNLQKVLTGEVVSTTGLGLGIPGSQRLMNEVEFDTSVRGTTVTMRKHLPPLAARHTGIQLQAIVDNIGSQRSSSTLEEIQWQNQELMRIMANMEDQQKAITRANKELEETNTGVLALYDELETLHRVGLLLATKVELKDLIQAVVDATTELTMADFGLFILKEQDAPAWTLIAKAGKRSSVLHQLPSKYDDDHFTTQFGEGELLKVEDLHSMPSEFVKGNPLILALTGMLPVKAFLAVPVIDGQGQFLGTLVFGSERASIFTERSERIVSSIAVQAVVAIEKARLFDSVKAASEAKDRFLAMLSHELRTPLNPVLAIVSSLYDDSTLPAAYREDIATVLRNVQLEARIIDDLLDFQRLINGKLDLRAEPVNLHDMIHNVLEICQLDIVQNKHHLSLHLNATQVTVSGDSARLQQALWNIFKNAIKFTPPGGTISVSTSNRDQNRLAIVISDSGRGIAAEALPGIFDAFEQGDRNVNAEFGGLGLGLAITRTFVEKHGGSVQASSGGLDQGATITVELPWIALEAGDSAGEATGRSAEKIPSHAAALLLVDDHVDTLTTLARLLRKRGYKVATASTCGAALELATTQPFDIVVSDLGLPDRSGMELIEEIRKTSDVPAIALSGYGMESDVADSLKAGFTTHLTKPVRIEMLHQTIERLLT